MKNTTLKGKNYKNIKSFTLILLTVIENSLRENDNVEALAVETLFGKYVSLS
ncbi:MAG: hypothetical protein Q9M40_05465 [Sulfurimonas sp.]|nr:hypothetical protein [Sulfurimonas sp.]